MSQRKPTIINQHDYISINFGNNRRLTASHSGEKASGVIPDEVFTAFCKLRDQKGGGNYLERIQHFADNIATVWPDWDKPARTFSVNEPVRFDFGKRRGGMDTGTVTKVAKTVTVRFERTGLIRMAADLLAQYNP
jgi:hypothetical protein